MTYGDLLTKYVLSHSFIAVLFASSWAPFRGGAYPFPADFVGYDVIACGGFVYEAPIRAWAVQQPKTNFVIIDQSITDLIPNVLAVIFREDQAGYMAGVGAGLLSKTKVI